MKKLPIGIQSFKELIQGDFLYVDKTKDIFNLLETGKYYFISRPRRFGKSLLLSTIQEIYQGDQELFKGLWIENQWDWSKKNPVIHISFSNLDYTNQSLDTAINRELDCIAQQYDLRLLEKTISQKFRELLKELGKDRKVVLLIDEYNKPILDYLGKNTLQAHRNQCILDNFYSILKNSGIYLEFLLFTGVCKTYFTSLDYLNNLTFHPKFAQILGFTQNELERYFKDRIKLLKTNLEKLEGNYGGYSWDGVNFVYNPFSVSCFFSHNRFRNFWFNSGTPTFLVNLLKHKHYQQVYHLETSLTSIFRLEIENPDIVPLLFHTGYLSINKKERQIVELHYPNKEVKDAINHLFTSINAQKEQYV